MGRILGLDIGAKRTGVAISDELGIIASPLTTLPSGQLMSHLAQWVDEYQLQTIVIGEPKNLQGRDSDNSYLVNQVRRKITERFPNMVLVSIDERFTSKMASQSLVQSGMKKSKRRNKEELDKVSAAIILQDYLDS